ncbi:hypothetical protein [Neorhodopirellula pilleata]|uniref:Uncharacterized protein n=1 Tax=Neorhodopirellula pilleata TaxID=2714738 RepID=A0A5C5ZPE8_9BACT|nr:hypothetical protein [Neorhodopirellula pilleata]TWT89392.1 hypothetical protein Pla100_55550 [Neorhodopirellula pilleata]
MLQRDLRSKPVIIAKGMLFLLLGIFSGGLLLTSIFSIRNLLLLGLTIWSFCRFYYFAFYVIEHYVDSKYRFTGLIDFGKYLFKRGR